MVFFCVSLSLSVMLDWIKPGATLLTVIFRLDNSNARDLTMPEIAALKKADGLVVGSQLCKEITRSLRVRQNPVTNLNRMVLNLKRRII